MFDKEKKNNNNNNKEGIIGLNSVWKRVNAARDGEERKRIPQRSAKQESEPGFNYLGKRSKSPFAQLLAAFGGANSRWYAPLQSGILHPVAITTIKHHSKVNDCRKPERNILSHFKGVIGNIEAIKTPRSCKEAACGLLCRADRRRDSLLTPRLARGRVRSRTWTLH